MTKRFDRSDPDVRGLVACYRTLGERLSEEASSLRGFVHERYYPDFGPVNGIKRRTILRRFRLWEDIFREHAERLFRLFFAIEEKLVFSIATEGRQEQRDLFSTLRQRRLSTDRLLRSIHARLRRFRDADQLNSEALYIFCQQVERAALFAHFVALVLFQPHGKPDGVRDPRFIDIDWDEVERYSDGFPETVYAEIVEPADVIDIESEPIDRSAPPSPARARPPRGDRSTLLRRLR